MGLETVWIMGAGRFGRIAVNRLSKQHRDWQFLLVDPDKENLLKVKGPQKAIEQADGIRFLTERFDPGADVSWIIPTLPVHLAWEWCQMKMGKDRLVRRPLSSRIDSFLPNPMRGLNGDLYVSNADFICPDNCSEPQAFCTVTGQPRKKEMSARLVALTCENYTSLVLQSQQIAPGIGGYTPDQLFSFFKKIERFKGALLVCTACRCHGVITGAVRV